MSSLYLISSSRDAVTWTGTAILAGVSSAVIQLTKVFSLCGVMSDVHCNTSAAVCIPMSLRGSADCPEELSSVCSYGAQHKTLWDGHIKYKVLASALTMSQGWKLGGEGP